MNGPSHYAEAERLLLSCQRLPADEHDAAVYPAAEDGVNSVGNALAAAQIHATLALAAATTLHTLQEFYEIADDVQAWAEATDAKALDEDHTDDPAAVDHHLDHITGYALTTQPFDQNGGAA